MVKDIKQEVESSGACLVAVSKTKPIDAIRKIYDLGVRDFGENRAQELAEKTTNLPSDIRWHMIGHLQKNKVKYIAPVVHLIHSVDSIDLLSVIEKEAKKHNRIIPFLLQLKIAQEKSKYGLDLTAAEELLRKLKDGRFLHVVCWGVMGMATFTEDKDQVRKEFQTLKNHFDFLKHQYSKRDDPFCQISMGMSGDYNIALEEGSTMVRIGSLIFGKR